MENQCPLHFETKKDGASPFSPVMLGEEEFRVLVSAPGITCAFLIRVTKIHAQNPRVSISNKMLSSLHYVSMLQLDYSLSGPNTRPFLSIQCLPGEGKGYPFHPILSWSVGH